MGIEMLSDEQLKQLIQERTLKGDHLGAEQFMIELDLRKNKNKYKNLL